MHTVIVGGGFAGVKAALELSKRQVGRITLISDKPYFLHHATLYATATGRNTAESVIPLEVIFADHPNVTLVLDTITTLHPERHLVSSAKHDYSYGKLVLALGSVTTFFGIDGMDKLAFGMKTLQEVQALQEHIHEQVVEQKLDKEIFVIGGGQTGVELAGALSTYLQGLIAVHKLKNTHSKVVLVEAGQRLVPRMSTTAAAKIGKQLKAQKVQVRTNHTVQRLDKQGLLMADKTYPTATAIWTSGVANNPFFAKQHTHFTLAPNGRVVVNPYLEAAPDIYVIGDNNTVKYSGTAVPAMRQAIHVAKNIACVATKRSQKRFRPHSAPVGLPVGEDWGYVEWFGIYAAGRTGKLFRRWLELYGYRQILPPKLARSAWRAHDLYDANI